MTLRNLGVFRIKSSAKHLAGCKRFDGVVGMDCESGKEKRDGMRCFLATARLKPHAPRCPAFNYI